MRSLPMLGGVNPAPLAELGQFPSFAHHATCGRYDHHLVRPFGKALCLGCTCMYSGIALALIWGLVFIGWSTTLTNAVLVYAAALVAYIPSFFQPFVQKRWFKIPSRLLLGVGLGLAGGAAVVAPWTLFGCIAKVSFLLSTYWLYRVASKMREKHLDNPCRDCPWGSFPLCTHNLPKLKKLLSDPATEADQRMFLEVLVAQLEPLSHTEPRLGAAPHAAAGGLIGFQSVDRA